MNTKAKIKLPKGLIPVSVLMFFIPIFLVVLLGMAATKPPEELLRNMVLAVLASGTLVFLLIRAVLEDSLLYDNREHLWRFFLCYFGSLLLSVLFIVLPVAGWPFLVIAVSLTLFSNETIGMAAAAELIYFTVSFAGAPDGIFIMYFLTSAIGLVLYARLDEGFQAFYPTVISFVALFTTQIAVIILFLNERLNIGMFVMPVMNLFMNGILLMIILRYFSQSVIHKYRDIYLEINDPECELLVELKKRSKESYYRCVHTAYLCERTAVRLGLDKTLCKLGGYYFRLEEFCEQDSEIALQLFEEKYRFPPQVMKLLRECRRVHDNPEKARIESKEAVIILLADEMIKSLLYLFKQNKETKIDYTDLVNTILQKKVEKGTFLLSNITFQEWEEIRKILIGEELYYDFLR